MNDIEKNRSEYVLKLETQMKHASNELAHHKALADKWTPVVEATLSNATQLNVGLMYAGKRSQVSVDLATLNSADIGSLVTDIVDAFVKANVADRLKEVIRPEVERVAKKISVIRGAGQW